MITCFVISIKRNAALDTWVCTLRYCLWSHWYVPWVPILVPIVPISGMTIVKSDYPIWIRTIFSPWAIRVRCSGLTRIHVPIWTIGILIMNTCTLLIGIAIISCCLKRCPMAYSSTWAFFCFSINISCPTVSIGVTKLPVTASISFCSVSILTSNPTSCRCFNGMNRY